MMAKRRPRSDPWVLTRAPPPKRHLGRKGRAAMNLDGDSDEAELAMAPHEPPKKVRKRTGKELRNISLRGMQLTVKERDKVRGIAVPLDGGDPPDDIEAPAGEGVRRRSARA